MVLRLLGSAVHQITLPMLYSVWLYIAPDEILPPVTNVSRT